MAGAGDADGDGFSDVILGTPFYDAGDEDEGAAFVYLGGPTPAILNQPPVPVAGPDQVVFDLDNSGSATVTLDGRASFDPDGFIVSGAWLEGETLLGTSPVLTTTLTGTGDHTVVLTATDNDGTTRGDPVIIRVESAINPAPTVDSLLASPSTITAGETTTLSWTTTGATGVSIDNGVGAVVVDGNVTVTPTATTTYVLTATSAGGTATSSASVTVNPAPPTVDSLLASPSTITAGETTTLSWTTTGATDVSIDNGVGAVAVDGSVPVSPSVTTTYTLTATSAGGTATSSASVTVNPAPPTVDSLAASPSTITAGETTTLSWTTTGATGVSIDNGVGAVAVNGTVTVTPAATTTYTLTATGTGGTATIVVAVTVNPLPPTADSFTAAPATITAGETTTLSWTTTGATGVSIDNGVGAVAVDGSVTVSPSVTTTYTLTATSAGGTATSSATVTVNPAPPTVDSLAASPSTITAGETTTLSWTTTDATGVSIDNGVGAVAVDGNVTVTPAATTTYILTATSAGGTATSNATVTVNPALPTVDSVSATPSTITAGGSATLSWTTTSTTSVLLSIDNSVGVVTVAADGSVTVSPSVTTTYILTATSTEGTATAGATVTVKPAEALTITRLEFRANRNEWRVAGTSSISGPDNTMTLYTGPTAPGPVILGTAAVDSSGVWDFRERNSSVAPDSTGTISILSSQGGKWEGISGTGPADPSVDPPPTVDGFTAAPATITVGETTTMSWTTTGATGVSIDNGVGAVGVDGNVTVSPTATTTYTLTAMGTGGTATAVAAVTVNAALPPPPTVDSFTAAPATITVGETTTLSWTTTGATGVSIDNGVGAVGVDGSVTVSPTATTTYTLTAMGTGGTATAVAAVTVNPALPPPPTVDGFTAAPATITVGETTALSWTTTGATDVSIDNGVGAVAVDGSLTVSPLATTTYTLTATGPGGTATAVATVTVNPALPPPPTTVDGFTAAPATITAGETTTMSWTTTGATDVSIDNGVGAVAVDGNATVIPTVDTTYTLTATGTGGTATAIAAVTVNATLPPPPTVDSLAAGPSTISVVGAATLSWTTTGATGVSIDNGVGTVAVDGNVSLSPSATTTYTLTATGAGGTATSSATVTVDLCRPCNAVGLLPLTDLGGATYGGFVGGLYPGGSNTRPAAHEAAGLAISNDLILPRDAAGNVDLVNGKIGFGSIGMSNTEMEFDGFLPLVNGDPDINPQLVVFNGAQFGNQVSKWADPTHPLWTEFAARVADAGLTAEQLQVVWVKQASRSMELFAFPDGPAQTQAWIESTLRNLLDSYPNVRIAYLTSRIYGGYGLRLSPEPEAYENGFTVKWLIESQIAGNPGLAFEGVGAQVPWLSWGSYMWADGGGADGVEGGIPGRSDGLEWLRSDLAVNRSGFGGGSNS